jgi:HSP20 family protein
MFYRTSFGLPAWRLRSPFSELDFIRRQMDDLFEAFSDRPSYQGGAGVFPSVNLTETADKYFIRAELPGVKSGELDINVTDKTLTITGERKILSESADAKYHRRERDAGQFSRAIAMPGEIEADRVEASLTDGVLTIVVPKAAKAQPRKIAIN